jgi:RNA polymerase sigma-70 factor (ECF subfamily)
LHTQELTKIYLDLREPVYRYLLSMTGDRDRAEEWTQETFYRALLALPRFRRDASVKTWLFSIARITYLEKSRQQTRHRTIPLDERMQDLGSDPLAQVISIEEQKVLRQALAQLPEHIRTLLLLREYENMSYGQIAKILDRTENWCRVNCFRAKQQLKEIIYRQEGGDCSENKPL